MSKCGAALSNRQQRPVWQCPSAVLANYGCVARLQVLVYEILPLTIDIFSYAIGSRTLSANEQFFVGVVSLLQQLRLYQTFVS